MLIYSSNDFRNRFAWVHMIRAFSFSTDTSSITVQHIIFKFSLNAFSDFDYYSSNISDIIVCKPSSYPFVLRFSIIYSKLEYFYISDVIFWAKSDILKISLYYVLIWFHCAIIRLINMRIRSKQIRPFLIRLDGTIIVSTIKVQWVFTLKVNHLRQICRASYQPRINTIHSKGGNKASSVFTYEAFAIANA